jgi:hypothetical protein
MTTTALTNRQDEPNLPLTNVRDAPAHAAGLSPDRGAIFGYHHGARGTRACGAKCRDDVMPGRALVGSWHGRAKSADQPAARSSARDAE